MIPPVRLHLAWFGTLLLIFTAGCGSRFGTVEGTVMIDGKPANNGTVIFSGADNHSAGAAIGPDGSYVAENVPVGPVKIVIHQMMMKGGGPTRPGPLPGLEEPVAVVTNPVRIPPKYQSVETSDLTFTVTSGANEFDIALSSK
jgi:hypothetical protein